MKKQVSKISNALVIKQVLYFKQVSVTCKKILNRKNKKQEKNGFQNLPVNQVNRKTFKPNSVRKP